MTNEIIISGKPDEQDKKHELVESLGGGIPLNDGEPAAQNPSAEPAAVPKVKSSLIYFEQILCLLLIGGVAYWNSGPRLIAMVGFALGGAVLMDMVGCVLTKKTYNVKDLSTLMAGLCIALLMPSGISYGLVFFGSALTIAIKHIFGGKDNYIFNPTAAAFAFLILCYPGQMLLFPAPRERFPIWGEIDPTLLTRLPSPEVLRATVTPFDILMGDIVGAMGAVHILVLAVAGVCLLFRRSVSPTFTITALTTNLLFAGVFAEFLGSAGGGGNPAAALHSALLMMVSGSFLFMLIFLANDPQTLPATFLGKVYYGLMFGGAVTLFRFYGRVEGYPIFALLLVNTMKERSDILGRQTIWLIKHAVVTARNKLGSYERFREKAETEMTTALATTFTGGGARGANAQGANLLDFTDANLDIDEVTVARHNYNMPPLDNTIIKIVRKKPKFIVLIREKLHIIAEKRVGGSSKGVSEEKQEGVQVNFLQNLKDGIRDIKARFVKKDARSSRDLRALPPPEITPEEAVPEPALTPLSLSILIDDNDVLEVESETEQAPKVGTPEATEAQNKSRRRRKTHAKR